MVPYIIDRATAFYMRIGELSWFRSNGIVARFDIRSGMTDPTVRKISTDRLLIIAVDPAAVLLSSGSGAALELSRARLPDHRCPVAQGS
ncbi:hypothetical protein GCM10027610_090690 [Dactylosporangium cerinum]